MKRCRCSWPAVGPCSASKGHWGQSRQSCPATSKLSQSWQHELWGNCQGEHKGATCLTPRSSRRSTASIPVFPAPEFNFIRFHPNHPSTWAKKPNNALCVLCSVGSSVLKNALYLIQSDRLSLSIIYRAIHLAQWGSSVSTTVSNSELSDCSVSTTELSDRSCIWYWVAFGRKFQF